MSALGFSCADDVTLATDGSTFGTLGYWTTGTSGSVPTTSGSTDDSTTGTTGESTGASESSGPIGIPCVEDLDCDLNQECFDDPVGECLCVPGFVLCGDECVDISTDGMHYGTCNIQCGEVNCVQGLCGVELPEGLDIETPVQISGGYPTLDCSFSTEAVPERSINFANEYTASYLVAYQRKAGLTQPTDAYYNVADIDGVWGTSLRLAPDPTPDVTTDPGATTHGGTGIDYLSYGISCTSLGGADPATLLAGLTWSSGPSCTLPGDGPSVYSDLGAPAIYESTTASVQNQIGLFGFYARLSPCFGGDPGDGDCPGDWATAPNTNLLAHNNVVVNPCTHHAIALERKSGAVQYTFLGLDGGVLQGGLKVADNDADIQANSNCGGDPCTGAGRVCKCTGAESAECGETSSCLEINPRVHGAVRFIPGTTTVPSRCLMYLAYDRATDAGGDMLWKSRLKVFDITDESLTPAQAEVETHNSSGDTSPHNDFNSTILVDFFTQATGFFFYRQYEGNACSTTYIGHVRRTEAANFVTISLSSAFPSLVAPGVDGLGHYVAGSRFTEPGRLFPSWSQPVVTEVKCVECLLDQQWSVAVFAAGVRP